MHFKQQLQRDELWLNSKNAYFQFQPDFAAPEGRYKMEPRNETNSLMFNLTQNLAQNFVQPSVPFFWSYDLFPTAN